MPLYHTKKDLFRIAKKFVDCLSNGKRGNIPALKAKDFIIVLNYIKYLRLANKISV